MDIIQTWLRYSAIVIVTVSLIAGPGCASNEEKKIKHLDRAREYLEKEEFNNAVIELKNVIQLDPKNDIAYYELGETYLKLKQGQEAFQAFSRAVSANPDNMEAQLKLGQILLLGKKTEEAREKADLILEKSPDDIEALSLLSGVQIQEKDIDAAVETLKNVLSIDPNHYNTYLSLARLYMINKNTELAEGTYLKAISLKPTEIIPYVELSRLYGTLSQWDKAEQKLQEMLKAKDSDAQSLQIMARFYESRKKADQAEKAYLDAVDAAAEGEVGPLMDLAGFYARTGSYEKALELMEKALSIRNDDVNIHLSIAQLNLDFKKPEESEAIVDKILEKDKGNIGAQYLKGRLLLLKKDFSNALGYFENVLRDRPRDANAYYFKALCLIGKNETKLAQQELIKAIEYNPGIIEARLLLAEFYFRERDMELAREQVDNILKQSPDNIGALMLSGNLSLVDRDFNKAESIFNKVVDLNPDYAPVYVRLGILYNLINRKEDAIQNLSKCLSLDPLQMNALTLLVGLKVREKEFDDAITLCEEHKGKIGDNQNVSAFIEYMIGDILMKKEDIQKAQLRFEKAIEINPDILAAYLALARIYIKEGKHQVAIEQYEAILEKNPNYVAGYMTLGTIYELQGEKEKAEENYRKALDINKDFGPAANNLAWAIAEKGGNIDEALNFAHIAKEQLPKNAGVMDTIGWIYYLKGSYLNAISELEDALDLLPDNAVIHYHLGMAYLKNNQPDLARDTLTKALSLDEDFQGSDEARRIIDELEEKAS